MARANFVKKARKDIVRNDKVVVKRGQSYWWWQFQYRPKQVSLTKPKQSQLTQSDYKSRVCVMVEQFDNLYDGMEIEDIQTVVDNVISDATELRDEQEEKKNNMPESLQEAPTGELLQERYDALDNWIMELEGIDFEQEEIESLIDEIQSTECE